VEVDGRIEAVNYKGNRQRVKARRVKSKGGESILICRYYIEGALPALRRRADHMRHM